MQWSQLQFTSVILILFQLSTAVSGTQYRYQQPYRDIEENHRQGKIFHLWDGLERGLKDTADILSRVSDNLEVTFDQISDGLEDNLSTFTDKVGKRVHNFITPYLRRRDQMAFAPGPDSFDVNAIGGSIGGVDDGLRLYYEEENDSEGVDSKVPFGRPDRPQTGNSDPSEDRIGNNFLPPNFNPFAPFGGSNFFKMFNRQKPWWKGQNVCMEREEIDEKESNTNGTVEVEVEMEVETSKVGENPQQTGRASSDWIVETNAPTFQMSTCKDSTDKYTCVTKSSTKGLFKTVEVTYRCCHGFVRDGYGCSKVEIFPMPETLEKLASTSDFLSLIKAADMNKLLTESNLTLFVPTDEAIEEYTADLVEKNEMKNNIDGLRYDIIRERRNTHSMAPTLLAHMTDGFMYAGDFKDEQVIPSLNADSSLRLNIYSSFPPLVTVNCARIVAANHHSTNGVVHTIDRVLRPVEKSIADIIASDSQFTILKQLLRNTGMVEELRQQGQLTFFAPTDAAFESLKPATLAALLEGNSCLDSVLKHHIMPNTICSSAIQGRMKTVNQLNAFVVVERDEDDKLFIEDAQIVARDIMATNGVVHIIDKALMPNQAKSVSETLEFHNLTKFLELLEEVNLLEELNTQGNITVFAPSNRAFEKMPKDEFDALRNDKERLQDLLRYHVTTPGLRAKHITNNQLVDTMAGQPLRINMYSGQPLFFGLLGSRTRRPVRVTAGCSRVSILDSQACGGVVHVVEELFEVPKPNVMAALDNEEYSIFKRMIKESGMDKTLDEEGPFTLLAPSDHAFKTLPQDELDQMLENETLKEMIVKRHILQEHICCSGINSNNWPFSDRKRSLDGSPIHVRRTSSGRLMAGRSRIIECGSPTGNGIVHTINRMVVGDREINERVHSFPGFAKNVFFF